MRLKPRIFIFFCSFVCFALQFNLSAIFAFLRFGTTLIRLTPYFFLGCAISPIVLFFLRLRKLDALLPWLTPVSLIIGAAIIPNCSSEIISIFILLLIFSSSYAVLLGALFNGTFKTNYFADLLGAALGFIVSVVLLPTLTGEGIFLLIFAISFVPAALTGSGRWPRRIACFCLFLGFVSFICQLRYRSFDLIKFARHEKPNAGYGGWIGSTRIQRKEGELLASKWSAISRVDAIQSIKKGSAELYYNNRAWSPLTIDKSRRYTLLGPFYSNATTALVIGVGGGNDIQGILETGVRDITGVEVNDATVDLMKSDLRAISKELYWRVPIILSEGRAYLESTGRTFDLILLGTADFFTPQMQNNIFLESFLYTEEAINTYLDHLSQDGTLVILRSFSLYATKNMDSFRLLQTVQSVLKKRKKSAAEHLTVLTHGQGTTQVASRRLAIIIKNSPQARPEKLRQRKLLNDIPGIHWVSDANRRKGDADPQLAEKCLDLIFNERPNPCTGDEAMINTDDAPFFSSPGKRAMVRMFFSFAHIAPFALGVFLVIFFISGVGPHRSGRLLPTRPLTLSLSSGLAYGYLIPFFYHHFLVFSRSPLTAYALVQLGALAAAISASQIQSIVKRGMTSALLALAIMLLVVLHFWGSRIVTVLRPSEFGYNSLILAFVVPITFALGLIFPRALEMALASGNGRGKLIAEHAFGINLAGFGIGALLSFFTNAIWGLRFSLFVLCALLFLISALHMRLPNATVSAN